ncbi:MAG: hypothetical protein JOZ90_12940 [Alphaproteobacteria bacterium]|nr:hypothetical protein [Alphaproteobacteria bacterium]MBV9370364.1 hypothetical protein [Alphaproteobacteria bacterium]MBV9901979.1 hypothetical protein [Alphaproteobacteria bacterium]
MREIAPTGLLAAAAAASLAAQPAPAPTTPRPAPCGGPAYRQLDFWVGRWTVYDTAKGYKVGTSRIERAMNGCAIRESYDAPRAPGGAYAGASYSGYSRLDAKWHQMYVDVNGNVSLYAGGMEGADMILIASGRDGALQRMTYRPLADGSVRQIGIVSTDGGRTWKPGYDYTYRRR